MSTRPCPICREDIEADLSACPICGNDLTDLTILDETNSGAQRIAPDDKTGLELTRALGPRIEIVRKLGAGGMSTVYLGRDPALRRFVAIKVLSDDLADDPLARARFTREAEASAAISDPHVIEIFQVDTLPRTKKPYIMMQFVDGPTLQQELLMGAPLPEATAKAVIGEIAQALAAAHARGVVHRDIKPSNVVLDRESGHAVVLDFGISAALQPGALGGPEKLTMTGLALGTPAYMSPEQAAAKDVSDRSDVYSLGVVAYELVTGEPPFLADAPEGYLAAHLQEHAPHVSALRPELDGIFADIIMRMLSKNKDDRPTAEAIARALLRRTRLPVDWPPPGLASIRGMGWRTLNLGAGAGGASMALMLGLTFPNAAAISVAGSMTLLSLLLGAQGIFTGLTAIVLARLVNRWVWARQMGYPPTAILDVALDHRDDTRAVLNGSGPYALLEPKGRKFLMQLRRVKAAFIAGGAFASWFLPFGWIFGLVGGNSLTEGSLVSQSDLRSLIILPALALALGVIVGIPETRMRHRAQILRFVRRLMWKPREVRRELVNRWLDSAGHPSLPRGGAEEPPKKKRPVLGIATGAAALLFGAVVFAGLTGINGSSQTAHDWNTVHRNNGPIPRLSWEEIERSLGGGRLLPGRGAALTPEWENTFSQMLQDSNSQRATPKTLGAPNPWWGALNTGLTASAERELSLMIADSSVQLWHDMAHSTRQPALWPLSEGSWYTHTFRGGPIRNRVVDFAKANDASAILAMAIGETDVAVTRAREIIVVGKHLLNDPHFGAIGPEIIDFGAQVLEQVGLYSDDRALFLSAQRMRTSIPSLGLAIAQTRSSALSRFA
ncbi:MAG: serine/threonine protein kinase, partial [Gemmatimonadota bacterium]|nr:serine/threonine protein kinase [Gemmatimonadota bacterium]